MEPNIEQQIQKKAYFIHEQNPHLSDIECWDQAEIEVCDKIGWNYISAYQILSESFIEKHSNKVGWVNISIHQALTEPFIEKYSNKVYWYDISIHQALSEPFIEKHSNKVNWDHISRCQTLSESFIEKHSNKVDWYHISTYQTLSESFIEKHADKVDWYHISTYQTLSESFIEKHADKVHWHYISRYQTLSEPFIEKHADKVNWDCISRYQYLSLEFRQKHNIQIPNDNWLYKTKEEKIPFLNNYEIIDDYVIAYKSVRSNYESVYKRGFYYEMGKTYSSHCDCNRDNANSFGLSAWTKINALNYYNKGKLLKAKIHLDDLGTITKEGKIRARKLTVLEEVEK